MDPVGVLQSGWTTVIFGFTGAPAIGSTASGSIAETHPVLICFTVILYVVLLFNPAKIVEGWYAPPTLYS